MTLDRAKTILKYCGIVIAVGAILTTALGLFLAFGGGYASTNMPEAQTNPEMQKGTLAIMIGGILMAISGIIHLLQGIFSVKASNDSKFGKNAYLFGILGLVATVASALASPVTLDPAFSPGLTVTVTVPAASLVFAFPSESLLVRV